MKLESIRDREEIELLIRSSGEKGTLDAGEVELLTRSIRLAEKSRRRCHGAESSHGDD